MDTFEVGDLVRDKLNVDTGAYGLGVIVATERDGIRGMKRAIPPGHIDSFPPGKRYEVYFTKFEKTITFHGEYLEKV